jgi:hypothetical protein
LQFAKIVVRKVFPEGHFANNDIFIRKHLCLRLTYTYSPLYTPTLGYGYKYLIYLLLILKALKQQRGLAWGQIEMLPCWAEAFYVCSLAQTTMKRSIEDQPDIIELSTNTEVPIYFEFF